MTDRELLELAAKAVGLNYIISGGQLWTTMAGSINKHTERWNPLSNDGQALRLVAYLSLAVHYPSSKCEVWVGNGCSDFYEKVTDDRYSALRRAIVLAAAEMGKTKK